MRYARVTVSLTLAGTLLGCADPPTGPTPSHAPPPNALIAGAPTGDQYGNVAVMVGRTGPTTPWVPACTGTLVAPDIVLTAGHCLFLGPLFEGFTELGVSFSPEFSPAAPVVKVVAAHLHPDFSFPFTAPFPSPDNPYDIFDLGLLVLERAVGLVPAHLPPLGLLDHLGPSSGPLTVVGFGLPRADASWAERGTRRAGAVTLDRVFAPLFSTKPDPAVTCIGDSGGPIFRGPPQSHRGRRGVTMILGIAQGGDCSTVTTFYRLDTPQARDFMDNHLDLPG